MQIQARKFRLTGMRRNSQSVEIEDAVRCPARGDSAPSASRKGSGAWASRSVSPAPETLNENASSKSGNRKPEADFECGGRSPILPPGRDNNQYASSVTCPPADKECCHPEQAFFAQRGIWASRAKRCVLCNAVIARLARVLTTGVAGGPRSPQWKV